MNELVDLFFDKFQMAMTKLNPNWQEQAMDPDVSTSVELQKNKIMAVKWVISSSKDSQKLDKVLKEVSKEEGFELIEELLKRRIQKSKISQAQYEAGNYKKEHIRLHGLDIAIENKKNTYRKGTAKSISTSDISKGQSELMEIS
ncbi:hypothetical protein EHQ62_17075 [Leptospira jelokensis]|uniref:Inorganic pyrophosphatase domain-containing protein n=1 Tax=Leptospira jelokensis TaxID=2484931 RepID=A0A4Z0ZXZ1_9LEPT|nr:hypothetical protein EHQ62_17075 [Leptospira jelokensis]